MPTPRRTTRNTPQFAGAFDLKAYRSPKAYVRVSTDEQAEEGTSIETQIHQLKTYALAFGTTLRDEDIYIDDGWSGKDLERPAMSRLRADAQKGKVDCVLVAKLDRFSRSLRDTVNLCLGEWQDEAEADRKVILKSISEPFDTHTDFGRMVFGLLAMFAEFERRRIAERTWSGKTSRAQTGRNAGHRPSYGFKLVPAPDNCASYFEVVPEEAAVVKKICELYLTGFGDTQIALRLNEEGLRFRDGGFWQSQQVTRILTNPIIAGTYVYGRKATNPDGSVSRLPEDQWVTSKGPVISEPIISPETYQAIHQIRSTRWAGGRRASSSYLLSGLVRCGRCGSACGVKLCGPTGNYQYYRCLRRKQSGPMACSQPAVRGDKLEVQVLDAIRAVILDSRDALLARMRASYVKQKHGIDQQLVDLEQEERRVLQLKSNYFKWLESGRMRPDAVQQRLDELQAQNQELATRRASLEQTALALVERAVSASAYEVVLSSFTETWETLSPQERKRLVAMLIINVEINGFDVTISWSHDLLQVEFAMGSAK